MDEKLKTKLLTEIAASFPFTYKEVEFVYNVAKSIDATIQICIMAVEQNFASPATVVSLLEDDNRLWEFAPR